MALLSSVTHKSTPKNMNVGRDLQGKGALVKVWVGSDRIIRMHYIYTWRELSKNNSQNLRLHGDLFKNNSVYSFSFIYFVRSGFYTLLQLALPQLPLDLFKCHSVVYLLNNRLFISCMSGTFLLPQEYEYQNRSLLCLRVMNGLMGKCQ